MGPLPARMFFPFIAALEISEAKHADLIARMTAQLRELNSVKQDTQREAGELKKKLQVMNETGALWGQAKIKK